MKLIELHILQSFPVSCLNRDDVGAPKTAVFGGVTRARLSSQCLKRAIRQMARELHASAFRGSRTRKAADDLAPALAAKGWTEAEARKAADEVLNLLLGNEPSKGKKAKKGAGEQGEPEKAMTSTLLYLSPDEIDRIAQAIDAARREKPGADAKALKDAAVKALGKGLPKDAADIAVFGRMVANADDVTLEGAGLFGHALSTHRCDNDLDFWTAVDDQKAAGEDAGAGNMGTAEFASACYYRYAGLNLDLLFDTGHLGAMGPAERVRVVDAFVRATLQAVPQARQNSMNAHTLPSYALGLVRSSGHPLQLVNAFEKPVWSSGGLVEKSVEALKRHHEEMTKTWGLRATEEVAIPDVALDEFCRRLLAHVG
jgi:CRISPR system Cascade subunit CasC